ncbi:MAG: hypothetical protein EPN70_20445 [Paraburkholderia sp.]|uniref:hypothetical protein n=1 Tax=Paraburkholderia sp. TaxID=1926495 RepID=UPI0011F56375|nr:hypothetical protein [Paraburkholderia sp.]TAM01117.1 MAG: hypothetical protein EPN70_20445 [Paraburkholderia sp.]TAM30390.1 MAG: hypothetical protein EPN59_09535 [Paraburkholderia sp.]
MLIKLPEHDVSRRLAIAGWMLFPRPEDDDLRRLYRSAIQHVRVMHILKDAGQSIDPAEQKYKWVKSGGEMIAIEQNTPDLSAKEAGPALIGSPDKIVEFFEDYENFLRRADIDLLFRKGVVSGLILLVCCSFQNKFVRRYGDGKAGAQKAVAEMTKIGLTLVREYFGDFDGVAHLWASWLLRKFKDADLRVDREMLRGLGSRISIDFMGNVTVSEILDGAKSALVFGRGKLNTGVAILEGVDSIEFDWPEISFGLADELPSALVDVFEQFRPESKLRR